MVAVSWPMATTRASAIRSPTKTVLPLISADGVLAPKITPCNLKTTGAGFGGCGTRHRVGGGGETTGAARPATSRHCSPAVCLGSTRRRRRNRRGDIRRRIKRPRPHRELCPGVIPRKNQNSRQRQDGHDQQHHHHIAGLRRTREVPPRARRGHPPTAAIGCAFCARFRASLIILIR